VTYPTYSISSLEYNYIHLRSGKTLTKDQPHISIEELNEEVPSEESKQKQSQLPTKTKNSHLVLQDPPYPKRINKDKPSIQHEFDLLGEIKKCVCQNAIISRN
jgi:16S rRNA G966 N2-methylase RsmD